jgi:hypothetical protein
MLGYKIVRTGKSEQADYSGMSLQEQFQERYGKSAVNDLFAAFTYVKRAIFVVTWVAMGISYFHQRDYFASRHAGAFAWVVPVSIDCVMLVFMKISQLPAIKSNNRWVARGILIIPASGSMAINFMATSDSVMRWVYVGVVGAIVICEIGHGLMVPHLASMERKQAEMTSVSATAEIDEDTKAKWVARGRKAAATREANRIAKAEATQLAIEAATRPAIDPEAARIRGQKAAATRRANAEALRLAAMSPAARRKAIAAKTEA